MKLVINRCKRCLGSKKINAIGSLIKDCPECDGTGLKPKEVLPVVTKEIVPDAKVIGSPVVKISKKGGKHGGRKANDLHA